MRVFIKLKYTYRIMGKWENNKHFMLKGLMHMTE